MYHFMTEIEKRLIQDEQLMRLLVYRPMGFDDKNEVEYPDPFSDTLPDIVDGSKAYWALVKDRIRKGDKRTDITDSAKCIIYLQEGRERSKFNNAFFVDQEVILSILVHEEYEDDFRLSRIRDRVYELLMHRKGMAGFGMFESVGSDPRDAPKGFRRVDFRMVFTNNKSLQTKK